LKACNGVLMLDDLGRQRDDTNALVNRCLAPVAAGSERLPLPSGGGVDMPRDGLLVLITRFPPAEVIEPDLMRRIPYKIEVRGPSRAAFSELLRAEASARRIDLSDADATFVMDMIEDGYGEPLAYYQPSFLIRRLVAACDFQATAPAFTRDLAEDAISHLFVTRA
jgi:hypothetical protein